MGETKDLNHGIRALIEAGMISLYLHMLNNIKTMINMASQMKQFFDVQIRVWSKGGTVNKVANAMSSASNAHDRQ